MNIVAAAGRINGPVRATMIVASVALDTCHLTSDDLTDVIVEEGDKFVVLRSPETAEHDADYRELGRFATLTEAEAFLADQ